MDLFNNKKIVELNSKVLSLSDTILKTTNTIDDLERTIAREHGTSATYQSLINDYNKIGDSYMSNIYVRKGVDIKCQMIGAVEYNIVDSKNNILPESNKLQKLFTEINEDDNKTDFIYEIVRSLQRFGKAHVRFSDEKIGGVPVIVEVLPSDKVKPIVEQGMLRYWEYNRKKIIKENILFLRYKHPYDPFDGLSPVSSAVKEILQNFYAQAYNINFFKNGAMGKGYFFDPDGRSLSAPQLEEAQHAVDNTFNKGVDGAGKTLYLKRRIAWQKTSDTAKDMEFKVLLDNMRDAILVALDIPKVLFSSADATFTNLKEAKKMLWNNSLKPICKLIEDGFNSYFKINNLSGFFKFNLEDVLELQEDLNDKLLAAQSFYNMGVPMKVINEYLKLGLPEYEEEERLTLTYDDYKKESAIEKEKMINYDEFAKDMEYKSSLNTMLQFERAMSAEVKAFFTEHWKELEEFLIDLNKEYKEEYVVKGLTPNLLDKLRDWIKGLGWGDAMVSKLKPLIERVFNRGRYRTYAGIGMNFNLKPERAIGFLLNRGVKLSESPTNLLNSIVDHMSAETFVPDDLVKDISKIYKDKSIAKAKNVAMTETTAAYNGGRIDGMKDLGIEKKQWLHSQDGKVRSSHRIDSIIPVDEKFVLSDGYEVMYPGEGDPAHSCNCRCSVISVL